MSTKLSPQQIENLYKELLNTGADEELELKAQVIAAKFLSVISEAMDQQELNKALLAEMLGTSKSFITQLFRGDKLPSWKLLAKAEQALGIDFFICERNFIEQEKEKAYYAGVFSKPVSYTAPKNSPTETIAA